MRQLARVLGGPASDGGDLIIDITGMSACDDAGLQALVALTKRARLAEGDVILVAPAANIRETLSKAVEAGELRVEDDMVSVQPTP
ncbi:MAG: hypothetical protein JWL83_852 [Actinomycetia bacterium]|nr:hypothetical protein [Actinomycetes bacterium]